MSRSTTSHLAYGVSLFILLTLMLTIISLVSALFTWDIPLIALHVERSLVLIPALVLAIFVSAYMTH